MLFGDIRNEIILSNSTPNAAGGYQALFVSTLGELLGVAGSPQSFFTAGTATTIGALDLATATDDRFFKGGSTTSRSTTSR